MVPKLSHSASTGPPVFNLKITDEDTVAEDAMARAFTGQSPFHYGVMITDVPLSGLTARAVIVLDENDKVIHAQLVPEITDEPDYDAALQVLKK